MRSLRTRSIRTGLAGLLALAVLAAVGVASAVPAQAADNVVVRKVDTTNFPTVNLSVLKPPVSSSNDAVRISENGHAVTNATVQTPAEANLPMGVVLAIDTSEGMKAGSALDRAKESAKAMVAEKKANERIAIVAMSGSSRVVVNFTDDASVLNGAIDRLEGTGDSSLWGGLQLAAGLFAEAPDLQANVIVISGTTDRLSPNGAFDAARSSLRQAKAMVFPVVIHQQAAVESSGLQQLASDTGGRYVETSSASTTQQIVLGLHQNLNDQAIITYQSVSGKSAAKSLDIQIAVGTGTATVNTSPGTVSEGANMNPVVIDDASTPSFLGGPVGLVIIALVTLGFVGLLLYGLIEVVGNERNQLSRALRPYSDDHDERDISKLADSEILKKAVAQTAKMASDRGLLQVVQARLEQADLPLRPAEALFFTGLSALVAMIVGAVFFGILGLAAAGLVFAYIPILVTSVLAKRRRRRFTGQLPDTLQLLAGSLRAGYSLVQGLDAVSKQCGAPMGIELKRAMSEARLGRPVEEALQELSDRMGSDDFEWAVMAIKIQREVGGNLAELLMTVSETMVARERLRREVRALTAEGRISAIVLSLLPPIIGVLITFMNPDYMKPLFENALGQYALAGGGVMIMLGYWLMMKLIEIEA